LWLHSLKVAQLLRSAACLHTNQSRSYLNHLVHLLASSRCQASLCNIRITARNPCSFVFCVCQRLLILLEGQWRWLTPCMRIDPRSCAHRADVTDTNCRTDFGVMKEKMRVYARHQHTFPWLVYVCLYEAYQLVEFLRNLCVLEAFFICW